MAAHVSDFTKLPFNILLDLVNEQNGTSLPDTAITFGAPALTGQDEIQTNITASATTGSGYKGSVEFTYNRVPLSFMEVNEPDLVVETHEESIHGLIPFLNTTFGINLTADDIEDTPIPEQEPDVNTTITLTAKEGSLVFAGTVDLTFTLPLVELSTVLETTLLDGLYPPQAVVEEPAE